MALKIVKQDSQGNVSVEYVLSEHDYMKLIEKVQEMERISHRLVAGLLPDEPKNYTVLGDK